MRLWFGYESGGGVCSAQFSPIDTGSRDGAAHTRRNARTGEKRKNDKNSARVKLASPLTTHALRTRREDTAVAINAKPSDHAITPCHSCRPRLGQVRLAAG